MSVGEAIGCALIALGPAFWLLALTAADAVRIIALTAAAFCWLVALLAASAIRLAIPASAGIWRTILALILSVAAQEAARYGVYRLFRKAEQGLRQLVTLRPGTDHRLAFAYAAGLGFGLVSGAFSIVNLVADAVGPATVGLSAAYDFFFLTSAFQTLCMLLLHTLWSVVFFAALDDGNKRNVVWVVVSHFFVSGMTFLNKHRLYCASLLPSYAVLAITAVLAYRAVGGSLTTFKTILRTPAVRSVET